MMEIIQSLGERLLKEAGGVGGILLLPLFLQLLLRSMIVEMKGRDAITACLAFPLQYSLQLLILILVSLLLQLVHHSLHQVPRIIIV